MGGWPRDPDARKAIKKLCKEFGWTYDTDTGNSAHGVGSLLCGEGCRNPVWGTAKNPARGLWKRARQCPHGNAPDRVKP